MNNNLDVNAIEAIQIKKDIPTFFSGDTVVVHLKVIEGTRERLQQYEGVVIAKRKSVSNLNSSFIVRKISNGVAVERTFQTHSPLISKIEVKRRGCVRRAKLYYLRDLSGKKARIKEKIVSKKNNKSNAVADDLKNESDIAKNIS